MDVVRLAQIARLPLLVVLLLVAVSAKGRLVQALTLLDYTVMWGPWLLLAASGAAFAVAALWNRDTRHPAGVLAVEGLVAGVLGLLPPLAWIMWFGVGTFSSFGVATGNLFAQALAIVWLVIVIMTAVRQRRGSSLSR